MIYHEAEQRILNSVIFDNLIQNKAIKLYIENGELELKVINAPIRSICLTVNVADRTSIVKSAIVDYSYLLM